MFRSINSKVMATVLYLEFKSKYETVTNLKTEKKFPEYEQWFEYWLNKSMRYHSFISELGHRSLGKEVIKTLKNIAKDDYNIKGPFKLQVFTDYVSKDAWELLTKYGIEHKESGRSAYSYEHIIPKKKYIEEPIRKLFSEKREVTIEDIKELLDKYYFVALITKKEHEQLNKDYKDKMPDNWDGVSNDARYKDKGIELVKNPILETYNTDYVNNK